LGTNKSLNAAQRSEQSEIRVSRYRAADSAVRANEGRHGQRPDARGMAGAGLGAAGWGD